MQEDTSLWVLFISSFLAATLLPGGSEAVLYGVLQHHSGAAPLVLALATLGNTLGGMTSYVLGRMIPRPMRATGPHASRWQLRALEWTRRYGSAAMLAAWVPFIGDPLCVAAGWLRLNWLAVLAFMAIGKLARYGVIAWIAV